MWQRIQIWLNSQGLLKSQTLEQKEEALEAVVKLLEERAEFAEKEAILRKRIADANRRIKAVSPKAPILYLLIGVVAVVLIIFLVRVC